MTNLAKILLDIQQRKLKVATSRGALAVQQTERNAMKREIVEEFYKDLMVLANKHEIPVYMTEEGPVIGIENESVEEQVGYMDDAGDYTPMLSISFDIKIKNLDFDPEYEEESYEYKKEEARIKEEQKAKEKALKIARDAEIRAEKARLREQRINELMTKTKVGD